MRVLSINCGHIYALVMGLVCIVWLMRFNRHLNHSPTITIKSHKSANLPHGFLVTSRSSSSSSSHLNQKYYTEDLESFFNVKHLKETILDPKIARLVQTYADLKNDHQWNEATDESYAEQFGPYLDQGFENDRRTYIRFVSKAKGYGLFASLPIQPGQVIGEYTGVITNNSVNTDYTWDYPFNPPIMKKFKEQGKAKSDSFSLSLDARFAGNTMRFVNHNSKHYNAEPIYVPWKGLWRVIYVSKRYIDEDEEVTTTYGEDYFESRSNLVV